MSLLAYVESIQDFLGLSITLLSRFDCDDPEVLEHKNKQALMISDHHGIRNANVP